MGEPIPDEQNDIWEKINSCFFENQAAGAVGIFKADGNAVFYMESSYVIPGGQAESKIGSWNYLCADDFETYELKDDGSYKQSVWINEPTILGQLFGDWDSYRGPIYLACKKYIFTSTTPDGYKLYSFRKMKVPDGAPQHLKDQEAAEAALEPEPKGAIVVQHGNYFLVIVIVGKPFEMTHQFAVEGLERFLASSPDLSPLDGL